MPSLEAMISDGVSLSTKSGGCVDSLTRRMARLPLISRLAQDNSGMVTIREFSTDMVLIFLLYTPGRIPRESSSFRTVRGSTFFVPCTSTVQIKQEKPYNMARKAIIPTASIFLCRYRCMTKGSPRFSSIRILHRVLWDME